MSRITPCDLRNRPRCQFDGAAVPIQVRKMRRLVLMVGIIGSDIIVTLWLAALLIERTGGVRPF